MVPPPADLTTSLALAVIASSQAPLLLLDGDLNVIAGSASFCASFDIDPAAVRGRSVFKLGAGEWDMPRLRSLLTAVSAGEAEVEAYELDLVRPGQDTRRLRLNTHKLEYSESVAVRLMLTVTDLTDARAAEKLRDNLVREKDILLQEVQHRVANSLQIIASVLLQNARKVQSEEPRGHLRDASQRVLSVAAIQKQLAQSRLGDVILKPYFDQLCTSIGASMIADHEQIRIEVSGDGSATSAEISVSLGLIVTELVINALKHAFPGHRKGVISVDYHSVFDGWTLAICDNGVGMPKGGDEPAKPGLGTSIVEALANQLSASVKVEDLKPGTGVSIVHVHASAALERAAGAGLHAV